MNGSLRQRGPGTWELTVDLGRDGGGNRKRRLYNVHGTKADAQRRLRELLSQVDRGLGVPQGRILLRDWLKRWMTERIIPYRRQTTIERYRGIIEREIIPGLGHLDIARLGPGDIQAFQANLMGRFAPKTVVIIHGVLSGALKHAMRMELIYRNPTSLVSPPQPRSHEVIPAGVELVRATLDLARTEGILPLPVYIHLIAYTGMRHGEALALTWGKVDLGAGRLIIDATLGRTLDKGLVVEPPKTESGRRVVDLDAATIEVLSCHWDIQRQTKKLMREDYAPNNLVFAGPEGEWLNPMALTRAVKRLGAQVGAENLTVRSLRQFHASVTLQSGQSVVIASKRLGHASVSITEDIYAHSLPGWQKQAAEAFAKAMEG